MPLEYCLFKGTLVQAAPYKDAYQGNPHYIITLTSDGTDRFNVVVNSASQLPVGPNEDTRVLSYIDPHFEDAIMAKLVVLDTGLHTSDFPKLDYWQDKSLLDITRFRVVPYQDEDGNRFDINDQFNGLLTIDDKKPSFPAPFNNGKVTLNRDFWTPDNRAVTVYGFGFLFADTRDGLHETHMNQGNSRSSGHARENGPFQDGAVIVEIGGQFSAAFTAFQSQFLPTLANGYPAPNARPIDAFLTT
jgi:uncharacterized protein YukJ